MKNKEVLPQSNLAILYLKKSYFLFLICTFFFGALTIAQPDMAADVIWGEELKEPAGTRILSVFLDGNGGFYAVRSKVGIGLGKKKSLLSIMTIR